MRNYYEIEFAHRAQIEDNTYIQTPDRYSICIIAEHYPTEKEAEDFCKEDMEELGYDMVSDILLLEDWEAHKFFDMENEERFPVLK